MFHWGCILMHSARYLNLKKAVTCSHSQPLEWPQVAASGRKWPPLQHNVMTSKRRKTATRSRRQPTYPSQLEKDHLSNKTYFFKMFEDYRQKAEPNVDKKSEKQLYNVHWKRRRLIKHETIIKRNSLTLKRRVIQNI